LTKTGGHMSDVSRFVPPLKPQSTLAHDLDAKAVAALDEAHGMPPGDQRTEATRKAMVIRNASEILTLLSSKPGAPVE
jgi:hypothetical protein